MYKRSPKIDKGCYPQILVSKYFYACFLPSAKSDSKLQRELIRNY